MLCETAAKTEIKYFFNKVKQPHFTTLLGSEMIGEMTLTPIELEAFSLEVIR